MSSRASRGRRRRDSYDEYPRYNSRYYSPPPPRYHQDDRYPEFERGRQWYDDNYAYRHESYDSNRSSNKQQQQQQGTKQAERHRPRNSSLKEMTSRIKDLVVRSSSQKRSPSPGAQSDATGASTTQTHGPQRGRSPSLADSSRSGSLASSVRTRETDRSRGVQGSRAGSERGGGDVERRRRRDRSRHRHEVDSSERIKQALLAGLAAGAVEAIRVRNDPGPWRGPKGRRVVTAAFSAAAIEAAIDKHPEHNQKKKAVIAKLGGLVMSRLINGPPPARRKGRRR